jgi:hypothetical protein
MTTATFNSIARQQPASGQSVAHNSVTKKTEFLAQSLPFYLDATYGNGTTYKVVLGCEFTGISGTVVYPLVHFLITITTPDSLVPSAGIHYLAPADGIVFTL